MGRNYNLLLQTNYLMLMKLKILKSLYYKLAYQIMKSTALHLIIHLK